MKRSRYGRWTAMAAATAFVVATAWCGATGAVAATRGSAAAPAACGPDWSVVPSPGTGYLEAVAAASATSAYAVGFTLASPSETIVSHWDGGSWTAVDTPVTDGGRLKGVAVLGTKSTWAVGSRVTNGSKIRTLVEHGTPKGWKVVKSPSPDKGDGFNAVSGSGPDDVWAVGGRAVGKKDEALIEHYDGGAWTVSDSSALSGHIALTGVFAISPTDAWAVGSDQLVNDRSVTVAAHWDGVGWTRVATPNASNLLDTFAAVSGTASNDVWAVGETLQSLSGPVITTLAEHWDGTRWQIVASPNLTTNANLSGVAATTAGHEVAVGPLDNFQTPVAYNWDGVSWTTQSTPEPGVLIAVGASAGGPTWAVGELDNGAETLIEEACP